MPVSDYTPSVQDVANVIPTRTKDQYGNETGNFSSTTRPTDTQVTATITSVLERIADLIGDDIPAQLFDDAKFVVAERAAMQIELDFFPEQVNTNRSSYKDLKDLYETDVQRLGRQVQVLKEGGEIDAQDAQPSMKAQGAFPDTTKYPPLGFGTRW